MTILVTGCNGFIGGHLLRELGRFPGEVVGCGRSPRASADFRGRYVRCDLFSPGETENLIAAVRPRHIVHLAWHTGKDYWTAPENVPWVDATRWLMECFLRHGGKRFVGAGTCVEYAPTRARRGEESTPTLPDTLYGQAKLACCDLCACLAACHDLSFAWCRPFYVCGPGEPPSRLIPSACAVLRRGGVFAARAPDNSLDYMDVRDVAAAFAAVLFSPARGVVNLCSGKTITVREICERIVALTGTGSLAAGSGGGTAARIFGDPGKLRRETDFIGRYAMEDSLRDYLREQDAKEGNLDG